MRDPRLRKAWNLWEGEMGFLLNGAEGIAYAARWPLRWVLLAGVAAVVLVVWPIVPL
jgi:hypothetical protein